jgi:predicted RNA-binding protein with PUA-like domain
MVDVRFVKKAKRLIPLQELKRTPDLNGMVLFKNSRLSVQPLTPAEWRVIMALQDAW